ncbi:MAG: sortase [Chloroflexi bacterium]|nr:sortase [Chloroflexota bacterium]
MARWFSGVRPPADWRRRAIGVGLIAIGVGGVGLASWVYYDAWAQRQAFDASPEAAALQRQADAPTPVWVDATPQADSAAPTDVIAPVPTPHGPDIPLFDVVPTPAATATADQLSLDSVDFRFLDPPQPGAHARVAFTLSNHANVTSSRILLGINSDWFDAYSIIGTGPAVSEDRVDDNGLRTFNFPPIAAQESATYELDVTSTKEGTTAPSVTVLAVTGDTVGEVDAPQTFAPPPRPGPVMAVDIPRLQLHTGVLQVAWEPPPFTVGQIEDTANISQGNTVLVGHLTGLAGNVFAHLDQLQPGDEITATSRGLPYKFVVSRTFVGANTDSSPIDPEADPRLTLMTCTGVWNPFTHDYSQRLWVIAEPPDQAAVTIANAQATATVVSATATAQATEDAAATATAANATATAVALLPTATPVPTPFAGEPSLPGGIGNTRVNLEKTFGQATGETGGKLVVFRQPGKEVHVEFSPDPPRALLVAEMLTPPLAFDAAVRDARKLFPSDAQPRDSAPEGNAQFVVERFTSPQLAQALSLTSGDFSVIYTKNSAGAISSIVLGLGDDLDALQSDAKR